MNDAGSLPKQSTEKSDGKRGDGMPAVSANWMKHLWWKYSQSAQRVSPPPRFLLVVLLCAQILFLAIVRLGPTASMWGAGTGSSSQASSILYPTLRGNTLNRPYKSVESQEFPDEESKMSSVAMNVMRVSDDPSSSAAIKEQPKAKQEASFPNEESKLLSSSSNVMRVSGDPSSSAVSKEQPNTKQKASFKRVSLKKSKKNTPSLSEKKRNVASLGLQKAPDHTVNAAARKLKKGPDFSEPFDDLLPSVDDKSLADPASKQDSLFDLQEKSRETVKNDSPTDDIFPPTMDKEGDQEEATSADVTNDDTMAFSRTMKARRVKDAHDENAGMSSKSAARTEPEMETQKVLSGEEVSESALFTEKVSAGEPGEKERQQASFAEKGNEAISNVDVESNSVKQEVQEVFTEEASEGDKKAQYEPRVEETQAKNSDVENERGLVKEEPALIEQKVRDETSSSECRFGYIYVYDLPPTFNHDIISNCTALNPWLDVCPTLSNGGLGESLGEASPLGQTGSWYISDQFMAEIVFHNRILQHPCLTDKMEAASGFYIPFYAGLDVGRHLWQGASAERRDMLSNQFLDWLTEQPAWKKNSGSDHFMMIGRITWDFRRSKEEDWGSGFFYKPAMQNTMKLLIERNPWDDKEMAVPYPTNFHPQSDADLVAWQNHIRGLQRNSLFSFAGAPRDRFPDDFRRILFEQCQQAEHCRSLDCSNRTCDDNQKSLELFMDSTFCLQPRGDSFTRRSTFDCLLAGSIPVFFWHRSAYMQYKWHLPADEASYSVFISKQDMRNGTRIEEVLKALSPEKVQSMQEAVIQLVPRIVYAASGFSLKEKDAFDVAIEGVMRGFKESSVSAGR